jgi:hypothetical protein
MLSNNPAMMNADKTAGSKLPMVLKSSVMMGLVFCRLDETQTG